MLPKSYLIAKWTVYSLATLLLFGVQFLLLDHVTILSVHPFLYPILPALAAMYEGLRRGSTFALSVGLVCDLLLQGPFPGFYAIVFTLAAILSAQIAEFLLAPGWLCGFVVSFISMFLCGFGRILAAFMEVGESPLFYPILMTVVGFRETAVTLPWVLLALPIYRFIRRRCAAAY